MDAVEDGLGQLAGRELTAGEEVGRFVDGQVVECQGLPPTL
ncbi:MAG: hypothetical protein Q8P22_04250 [Chloroflexota bacterium]|nr:hypothetical protein [Chloroflexota bacterium]